MFYLKNVSPKNKNPTAEIKDLPTPIYRNEEYNLSGIGIDQDGHIVLYEWDFDGNGIYDYASRLNGNVTYIYNTSGHFNVTFKVTDDDGAIAKDFREIYVIAKNPPFPPRIWFLSPTNGSNVNDTINITGEANSGDKRVEIISIEIKIDNQDWITTNCTFRDYYPDVKWYYNLNTTTLANGEHTIFARTVDNKFGANPLRLESIIIIVNN